METVNELFEHIEAQWSRDSVINKDDVGGQVIVDSRLHAKYFRFLNAAFNKHEKLKNQRARLILLRQEYFMGLLDSATLAENGWKPFNKRLLKTDVGPYLAADPIIQDITLEVAQYKQLMEFLESIINQITYRSNTIRNLIDYMKFTNGS